MPDAWRTRSLVCKGRKHTSSHHRYVETIRHSLRNGFTAYTCPPRCTAIECTHLLLRRRAKTDSLGESALWRGGLMSMEVGLGRFGDRRLEKGGPRCTRPSCVGLVRAFGGLPGIGHERFGSHVFCATRR